MTFEKGLFALNLNFNIGFTVYFEIPVWIGDSSLFSQMMLLSNVHRVRHGTSAAHIHKIFYQHQWFKVNQIESNVYQVGGV
jgi:hypothetical protein